jgi:hypothetical protein
MASEVTAEGSQDQDVEAHFWKDGVQMGKNALTVQETS